MSNSCAKMKVELAECIKKSPCWNSGKTFGECLRSTNEEDLGKKCFAVRKVYRECKRGQVKNIVVERVINQLDMRYRFRGNPYANLPPDDG